MTHKNLYLLMLLIPFQQTFPGHLSPQRPFSEDLRSHPLNLLLQGPLRQYPPKSAAAPSGSLLPAATPVSVDVASSLASPTLISTQPTSPLRPLSPSPCAALSSFSDSSSSSSSSASSSAQSGLITELTSPCLSVEGIAATIKQTAEKMYENQTTLLHIQTTLSQLIERHNAEQRIAHKTLQSCLTKLTAIKIEEKKAEQMMAFADTIFEQIKSMKLSAKRMREYSKSPGSPVDIHKISSASDDESSDDDEDDEYAPSEGTITWSNVSKSGRISRLPLLKQLQEVTKYINSFEAANNTENSDYHRFLLEKTRILLDLQRSGKASLDDVYESFDKLDQRHFNTRSRGTYNACLTRIDKLQISESKRHRSD